MKQQSKHSVPVNLFRAMLLLALIGTVHAAPLLIEQIPDPEEAPSAAELIALEQKAEEGDWRIKQQFAAAYLYEHLALPEWNHGCRELKHGHYCRALAARVESGQRFLYQIVELPTDGPIAPRQLAVFQRDFAHRWQFAARPQYDPEDHACKKTIRYFERAIENELADTLGRRSCSARRLAKLVSLGTCTIEDDERAGQLSIKSGDCPRY